MIRSERTPQHTDQLPIQLLSMSDRLGEPITSSRDTLDQSTSDNFEVSEYFSRHIFASFGISGEHGEGESDVATES